MDSSTRDRGHVAHTKHCESCGIERECDGNCFACAVCGFVKPAEPTQHLVYTLRVEITVPLATESDKSIWPTLVDAVSTKAKHELTASVLACLRSLDYECTDIEVMDTSVEED